jgi:hypothetical protein
MKAFLAVSAIAVGGVIAAFLFLQELSDGIRKGIDNTPSDVVRRTLTVGDSEYECLIWRRDGVLFATARDTQRNFSVEAERTKIGDAKTIGVNGPEIFVDEHEIVFRIGSAMKVFDVEQKRWRD